MPAKSQAQYKLMQLVAHGPEAARRIGIPQAVGREYADATKKPSELPEHKGKKIAALLRKK